MVQVLSRTVEDHHRKIMEDLCMERVSTTPSTAWSEIRKCPQLYPQQATAGHSCGCCNHQSTACRSKVKPNFTMPSCQVCNLYAIWWTMISPLLTMIITMAAVVTRIGIKRLIRCSSCIIRMIYKYYHERSVSQTGQGGPFSFSIDMNLPAKFDGHIGGKKHAAYHYCMQNTQTNCIEIELGTCDMATRHSRNWQLE